MYTWPSVPSRTNSSRNLQIKPYYNKLCKVHSLAHEHIALLCHSLTHSLPLAHMATAGNTKQCSMTTGGVPPLIRGSAPPSGNTKRRHLATLSSATPVSQWAPAFIGIALCITAPQFQRAPLPFWVTLPLCTHCRLTVTIHNIFIR